MYMKYNVREAIKNKQNIFNKEVYKVATHSDADGICSAVLANYAINFSSLVFPFFGEITDEDLALDMYSKDPNYSGIMIDHHKTILDYPNGTIIHADYPASLICYELFKDSIKEPWKVIVGLAGDGYPHLAPLEIWLNYPELLDDVGAFLHSKGKDYYFPKPYWTELSSSINNLCRINKSKIAFEILKNAKRPSDIINHDQVKDAAKELSKEEGVIRSTFRPLDMGAYLVWKINSQYNFAYLAASLSTQRKGKTVLLFNNYNNTLHIRGVLSSYLRMILKDIADIGGHEGFMGGKLYPEKSYYDLLDALKAGRKQYGI